MPLSFKILALLCGMSFFSVCAYLLRRKSMNPFYSCLWFVIGLLMISVVLFEKFYKGIADLMHIRDASFLVLVGVIFFLLAYVLHLSIKISDISSRTQELISHVAILEREADKRRQQS